MAPDSTIGRRRAMFRDLLRIRMVEERIAALYSEQEMRCPTHFSIGQEAAAVGVCAALAPADLVMSAHRSHAHYLAKGGNLKAMLAELYGKAAGCARGKGGSMHLIDLAAGFLGAVPIVGSTMPIAVGAALSGRLSGEDGIVAVFFGDGATETGVFYESLNFARLRSLPVLFVCENNLYSVCSPLDVRHPPGREIVDIARGLGVPGFQGDGNDIDIVHGLAEDAAAQVRAGGGPAFIELLTYRWLEHCGPLPDTHLGYRSAAELAAWQARDPVVVARDRLLAEGAFDRAEIEALAREIAAEIDAAVAHAKASPFPPRDDLFENVFAA